MLLRELTLDDLDQLMEIEEECFPALSWHRRDYINEIVQNPYAHFFGIEDQKLLGVIGIWFMFDQSTITTLGVRKAYRKQGLARQLMSYALNEAHRNGVKVCDLEVRVSNIPAIQLYSSFGFDIKGLRKNYYTDNHEDAYLMVKEDSLWQPF